MKRRIETGTRLILVSNRNAGGPALVGKRANVDTGRAATIEIRRPNGDDGDNELPPAA